MDDSDDSDDCDVCNFFGSKKGKCVICLGFVLCLPFLIIYRLLQCVKCFLPSCGCCDKNEP